ncbi:MAG: hypothetical protein HY097_09710, partial [Nitrospinae bacterium]|nr:hypothetical protein [Nitrospinota bacterium]
MTDKILNRGLSFSDIDVNYKLAIDPENLFWGVIPKLVPACSKQGKEGSNFVLPEDLMALYKKEQRHLDEELYNFRFNESLNCIYIDPTDRCNANCPYCYIPPDIRKNGTQMKGEELDMAMQKLLIYFKDYKKKPVIVFHAAEPLLVKEIIF